MSSESSTLIIPPGSTESSLQTIPLPEDIKNHIRTINSMVTIMAMISIGLLATMLSEEELRNEGVSLKSRIPLALMVFLTSTIGKVFVSLQFSEETVISGCEALYNRRLPEFLRFTTKSPTEKLRDGTNLLRSTIGSLFWSGIAWVSFILLAQMFLKAKNSPWSSVGYHIQQPYVYSYFVFATFLTNMIGWPSVHEEALAAELRFLNFIIAPRQSWRRIKQELIVQAIHEEMLHELARTIKSGGQTPIVEAITSSLTQPKDAKYNQSPAHNNNSRDVSISLNPVSMNSYQLMSNDESSSLSTNMQQLLNVMNSNPASLRSAYYRYGGEDHYSASLSFFMIKHLLAITALAISAWGFFNIVGLSEQICRMAGISTPAFYMPFAYSAYYSGIEVCLVLTYPLVCSLLEAMRDGKLPPSIVSLPVRIGVLIGLVLVVTIAALSNMEQSVLDGEPFIYNLMAALAAFGVEVSSGYGVIMRPRVEKAAIDSPSHDPIKKGNMERFQQLKYCNLFAEKPKGSDTGVKGISDDEKETMIMSINQTP